MKKSTPTQYLVNRILRNYSLCDFCIGRLISKELKLKPSSNLGKKFNSRTKKSELKKCFICKNIFEKLDEHVDHMIDNSSSYQFSTFLIGSILKPSISDNEDINYIVRNNISICLDISHLILSANYANENWKKWYDKFKKEGLF